MPKCWLGSFVNIQRIRTSITKEPCSFVIFHSGQDPVSPPLDLCMMKHNSSLFSNLQFVFVQETKQIYSSGCNLRHSTDKGTILYVDIFKELC